MKVRITMTGTAPIIMHNSRLANPLDPIVKEIKAISSKRKKTEEDHALMSILEFEGGLYIDPDTGPFVPGANVEKCIVEGARLSRNGKQIERGFMVLDDNPLLYKGPRDLKGLKADVDNFRDVRLVTVVKSRVLRTRPIFRGWSLESTAELDTSEMDIDTLTATVKDAGAKVGLGDYRPRYGRFEAMVEEL